MVLEDIQVTRAHLGLQAAMEPKAFLAVLRLEAISRCVVIKRKKALKSALEPMLLQTSQ